jgi:hypothetical protein
MDAPPSELSSDQVAELARIDAKVVPGRACGTCTLCCKVVSVAEVGKAAGEWCRHCLPGRGCGIHPTRPYVCRGAYCEWMISKGLGPEWKPERSRFALFRTNGGRRLTAHVDPGYPSAWRRSPYFETFKHWAREATRKTPDMHVVDVMIGVRSTVILPDREVELGIVAPDELVILNKMTSPVGGEVIEVEKIKRP